ncbi:MAG: hypothetical protein U0350_36325 [Caldilineaceae bacterium]
MSDQIEQTATETPNAGAGQTVEQPNAGATAAETKPFRVFNSQAELDEFMTKSKRQAERRALNAKAKELGFEDWEDAQEAMAALRQPVTPKQDVPGNAQEVPEATPATTSTQTGSSEAQRLKMALSVASDLNLPTALVARLQGDTPDEMKADGERLLALFQQPVRGPGIPSAPKQNQAVTFTRAQLQNPEFVRQNKDAILQASREGRIVDS